MIIKLYFEDKDSKQGGFEYVSLTKLMWWIFLGRIKPKEKSAVYYIRRIETINGKRI